MIQRFKDLKIQKLSSETTCLGEVHVRCYTCCDEREHSQRDEDLCPYRQTFLGKRIFQFENRELRHRGQCNAERHVDDCLSTPGLNTLSERALLG